MIVDRGFDYDFVTRREYPVVKLTIKDCDGTLFSCDQSETFTPNQARAIAYKILDMADTVEKMRSEAFEDGQS